LCRQGGFCFQESLALAREVEDQPGVANALVNLADAAHRLGDFAVSATLSAEALAASRAIGDSFLTALALSNLGQLAVERGEGDEARGWFLEALALSRQAGDGWMIADALAGLAAVATLWHQPTLAARSLGAAQAYFTAIGATEAAHHRLFTRTESSVRSSLSAAEFTAAWAAGRSCRSIGPRSKPPIRPS
jgi:tetratricopeptide (TPR) repeat protein